MSTASKTLHRVKPYQYLLQGLAYAGFAAVIGLVSSHPSYTVVPPGQALIKLSLSHPAGLVEACKRPSREALKDIPSHRRNIRGNCSRERWPVTIRLELDGAVLFEAARRPRGLSGDGASSFYEKFVVPSGDYRLSVKMRQTGRTEGWDDALEAEVAIEPGQNLVIGYDEEFSRFTLR